MVPTVILLIPKFRTSTLRVKIYVWQFMPVTPALEGRNRQILGVYCPANLAKIVNYRHKGRSCLKE